MSFRYFGKQPFASGVRSMGKGSINRSGNIGITQSGGFSITGFMYANSEFLNSGSSGVVVNHSGTASYDAFLSVYDKNFSLRWVTTISSSGGALFNNVQSLSDGSFICNGYYAGASATFFNPAGNPVLTLNKNGAYSLQPIWVKYDSNGNILWAHQTSFVGASNASSYGNMSSSSLSYDESSINIMGWVRFDQFNSDLNFGNGVVLPKLTVNTNFLTDEVSYVVNIDTATGNANSIVSFEISNPQPIGWVGSFPFPLVSTNSLLNFGSTMSLSKTSQDGKTTVLGGNYNTKQQGGGINSGDFGWELELFRYSQNSINTTTPFASSTSSIGRGLSYFIGQHSDNTLNPDWVITIGNINASIISNLGSAKNVINQILRDDQGNTYIGFSTSAGVFNLQPPEWVRYPNNYQSQPFIAQSDSFYIVKLDNLGDVIWFKRVGMSGNVGDSQVYPSFSIVGNTLIVSSQVKPATTWTYSAGDPEQLVFNSPVLNTHMHHSKWNSLDGKFLGVDLDYAISGSISSPRSSDVWISGPDSNNLISFGSISSNNIAGNNLANINGTILPSTIGSESQIYSTKYDSAGSNIDVSVLMKSLVSSKTVGGSDISVF